MLTHYIIVRRDLPLGVCAAMITHAAGESGALYQNPDNGRFRHAVAVVLEVKNEQKLHAAANLLWKHDIQNVEIHESGGAYHNQFMAIGLVPCERSKVDLILEPFQTLKALDKQSETV